MIKVLHTADWHIGQLFYEYDRSYEHEQFLEWLTQTLVSEKIDLLLISGDVFDVSNPSAASVRLFYRFLNQATRKCPDLQIIVTAGNHDSATRLESPKPLLESSKIHIIGTIEKDSDGNIDYEKLMIPIKDAKDQILGWCVAVPYLRAGDYPTRRAENGPGAKSYTYAQGVTAFYHEAYQYIQGKQQPGESLIALGHLHASHAEVAENDTAERAIMGGLESIGAEAFAPEFSYVALGHIHKAQKIAGKEHIRYSGSPLPLSFSEIHYKHQVIVFQLDAKGIEDLRSITVPVSVPLLALPDQHRPLPEVLRAINALTGAAPSDNTPAPYLEVRVLLDEPRPGLRHQIGKALENKHIRLAKIDVRYPAANHEGKDKTSRDEHLDALTPEDVFQREYQQQFQTPPPQKLLKLFAQAATEATQTADQS